MLAGTDTTSMGLSQIMELLAQNPDMQEKLRAEIKEAQQQHGDNVPYDILVDLPYLDAVCRESLRLYAQPHLKLNIFMIELTFLPYASSYPPAPAITRQLVLVPFIRNSPG